MSKVSIVLYNKNNYSTLEEGIKSKDFIVLAKYIEEESDEHNNIVNACDRVLLETHQDEYFTIVTIPWLKLEDILDER